MWFQILQDGISAFHSIQQTKMLPKYLLIYGDLFLKIKIGHMIINIANN